MTDGQGRQEAKASLTPEHLAEMFQRIKKMPAGRPRIAVIPYPSSETDGLKKFRRKRKGGEVR